MKLKNLVVGLGLAFVLPFAQAATKDEMVAFVKKADAYIKEKGFDAACAEFNKLKEEKGLFQDGELYVYVYDMDGKVLCHGADKNKIGKNLITYKDDHGKLAIQELKDAALKGGGFVDYIWKQPATGEKTPKLGYAMKCSSDPKCWLGSGIYNKDGK